MNGIVVNILIVVVVSGIGFLIYVCIIEFEIECVGGDVIVVY